MQFTKLRLSGFKSFVDPAEMVIAPGLTGIVGPNGCGKSNLLEALRWVMGDATPKSLRAGGMDDVIFAGTQRRPARNVAEVVLSIDNESRRAPAAFNDLAQIEVTRRIERESGSDYRINGKSVRARDVQLLFADCATGSDSPAMVSQGRVGALVTAKPRDRRAILEDAAGTSGLHQRRHEAELRLKAAEANLLRLQDLVTALEAQLGVVRRQARQADRYRRLSTRIRDVQAYVLSLRWQQASLARAAAEADCHQAAQSVDDRTRAAAEAAAARAEAAANLPALRDAERAAAAELARLTGELRALDEEEKRTTSRLMDLVRQLEHGIADQQREAAILADAGAALDRADSERAQLEAEEDAVQGQRATATEQTQAARDAVKAAEAVHDNVAQKLAHAVAERNTLNNRLAELERRLTNIRQQHAQLVARRGQMAPAGGPESARDLAAAATDRLEQVRAQLALARGAVDAAEKSRAQTQDAERQAQARLLKSRADEAAVSAEIKALRAVAAGDSAAARPLLDALTVEPGFEAALAAALGDDLKASLDGDAPLHWRDLPEIGDMPALPAGVPSLAEHVTGPALLTRRLAAIGLVEPDQGAILQADLRPGQRLVSRAGGLWRWDGYVMVSGAPQPAAIRLAQRNRLRALESELAALSAVSQQAEIDHRAAAAAQNQQAQAERAARDGARQAEQAEQQAHQVLLKAERDAARLNGELQMLDAQIARAEQEETGTAAQREELAIALGALPDQEELRAAQQRLRADMDTARAELAARQAAEDGLRQQSGLRQKRLQSLATEREAWRLRRDSAHQQMEQLQQRRGVLEAESVALQDQARGIAPRRAGLADGLRAAEATRAEAADHLATAESRMTTADRNAHAAEAALAEAREAAIRLDAARERAMERCQSLTLESLEQFETEPGALGRIVDPDLAMGLEPAEAELAQLKADRERMGPVNLLAEQEEAELDAKYQTTISERADLEQAIGRLRQAIGQLNREGRDRLQAAFGQVDAHFRELYQTLFQGGEARLELTESDDPLEAGLDILASPPGKRLQSLSLLSGGEQALTALALIFAVFLTNPSPICVLDEVDAPLDDANVERFCTLLDEMTRRTGTRFLIVTHNAFTMSRMHRLYGVTMGERGVSSLVSVALDRAPLLLAAE